MEKNASAKICERCKTVFQCRPGDICNCDCSKVEVPPSAKAMIKSRYRDCLCVDCLREIVSVAEKR